MNSLLSFFFSHRSRRSVDFVYRWVWRRQDRKHEESDTVLGLCGCVKTQVQCGKLFSKARYSWIHVCLAVSRLSSSIKPTSSSGGVSSPPWRIYCRIYFTHALGVLAKETHARDRIEPLLWWYVLYVYIYTYILTYIQWTV